MKNRGVTVRVFCFPEVTGGISAIQIRARIKPGLPSREALFRNYVQKQGNYSSGFSDSYANSISGQSGNHKGRKKCLIGAFWRAEVRSDRTVLGVWNEPPAKREYGRLFAG